VSAEIAFERRRVDHLSPGKSPAATTQGVHAAAHASKLADSVKT
jgi:hypothetical protein